MKIYIFVPEPTPVDTIPPQLGPEIPAACIGDGKALLVQDEWRLVRTPDESGHIDLVWGWYYDTSRRRIYLNLNDAPEALLAYFVVKGKAGSWKNEWLSGRMNTYFRPSEIGDPARSRAKYARVANRRLSIVEKLRHAPEEVLDMLTNGS